MHQVEALPRRSSAPTSWHAHLDRRAGRPEPSPRGVDVGREDPAGGPHLLGQPDTGTDVPPAPTSQQRQPGPTPSPSMCRNVVGSKSAARASKRCAASVCRLSRRYPSVRVMARSSQLSACSCGSTLPRVELAGPSRVVRRAWPDRRGGRGDGSRGVLSAYTLSAQHASCSCQARGQHGLGDHPTRRMTSISGSAADLGLRHLAEYVAHVGPASSARGDLSHLSRGDASPVVAHGLAAYEAVAGREDAAEPFVSSLRGCAPTLSWRRDLGGPFDGLVSGDPLGPAVQMSPAVVMYFHPVPDGAGACSYR